MNTLEDEFLAYLKAKMKDRLIMSFDNTDLLLWGARKNNEVKLLGLTLNIGTKNLRTIKGKIADPKNKVDKIMRTAYSLSNASNSTFFGIVYSLSGDDYFIVTDPRSPLDWTKSLEVEETEMPSLIQNFFKTKLGTVGTTKAVNKATSDWFHVWARANLPLEYVRVNLDGLILNKDQRPKILLETKRSFYSVDSWLPWEADSRNYYLQNLFATNSGLGFWTVYHKKGMEVNDETRITLFMISAVSLDADRWITYHRVVTEACKVLKLADE